MHISYINQSIFKAVHCLSLMYDNQTIMLCTHMYKNKSDINSPELNVTLDNLLIQLRPQVTPVWYKFGEAAGIEKGVLDDFAKQCTPEDCVMECWTVG